MPVTAPRSLTDDEVYAVTAYILHLNGIIAEDHTLDAQTLPAVRMPNRRTGMVPALRGVGEKALINRIFSVGIGLALRVRGAVDGVIFNQRGRIL